MILLGLAGCGRGCASSRPPIHLNPNMDLQPKYKAQASSEFFYDGATMRTPVEGTVARGELNDDVAYYEGKDESGEFVAAIPIAVDESLLERGGRRYAIYCAVCHTETGDGNGVLLERGGVPMPSFHEDRLREIPDGHIYDVITNGLGLMSAYKYPIPVEDRWAIVAHVRRLQREHHESGTGGATD